jgi:uncharacterized membrane protein
MAKEVRHKLSKSRIEGLTDSLFATVMTILVLSLVVPVVIGPNSSKQLSMDIISLLPNLLLYVATFIVLGVIWIGHNSIFRYVHKVDNRTNWIMIIFLLSVGIIPFSTALLGKYPLEQPAIILYSSNFFLVALMFNIISRHVMRKHKESKLSRTSSIGRTFQSTSISLIIYAIAIPLSYISPYISLGLFVIVPSYYIIVGLLNPF